MKKIFVAVVIAVFLVSIGNSWATTITIDRVSGYYSGNGGEFNIANFGATTNSLYATNVLVNNRYGAKGFETFCLETDEYVNIPGTYDAVINPINQAYGGGANSNTGDTISKGTAWLYYQFSVGALSGYNYTAGSGRVASAAALQNTIWALEDEGVVADTGFTSLLINQFGSFTAAKADYANSMNYGVGVLNLTASGALAQDQLVRTSSVPEPATLLLLGLGLIGLSGVRKIMNRRSFAPSSC